MNDMELLKRDLFFEIQRCEGIFNSNIFINHSIFTESAFIEMLIRLNYVLKELNNKNNRIVWTNDIQTNQRIKDITDLVRELRNTICHSGSELNKISNSNVRFVFNAFVGKLPKMLKVGNISLGSDYEDDIAFYYGDMRIYLVRHIKKLLEELPNEINKLK